MISGDSKTSWTRLSLRLFSVGMAGLEATSGKWGDDDAEDAAPADPAIDALAQTLAAGAVGVSAASGARQNIAAFDINSLAKAHARDTVGGDVRRRGTHNRKRTRWGDTIISRAEASRRAPRHLVRERAQK